MNPTSSASLCREARPSRSVASLWSGEPARHWTKGQCWGLRGNVGDQGALPGGGRRGCRGPLGAAADSLRDCTPQKLTVARIAKLASGTDDDTAEAHARLVMPRDNNHGRQHRKGLIPYLLNKQKRVKEKTL